MAAVTTQITVVEGGNAATASVTYDDVSRAITQVAWTIVSGTLLSVTVSQAGKPDVTTTNLRASGSKAINKNAGYTIDAASIATVWSSV